MNKKLIASSLVLSYACVLLLAIYPLQSIYFWFFTDFAPNPGQLFHYYDSSLEVAIMYKIQVFHRLTGFVISLIPVTLHVFIFYRLYRLFHSVKNEEIFSNRNVTLIKSTGLLFLWVTLLEPIIEALTTLVLTWSNPVGHRLISMSFTDAHISKICLAVIVFMIGWVVSEGVKLNNLNKYTV